MIRGICCTSRATINLRTDKTQILKDILTASEGEPGHGSSVAASGGTADAANAVAADGHAADGTAEAVAADGNAADGDAADGTAVEAVAVEGDGADGDAADGAAVEAVAVEGDAADGDAADGAAVEAVAVDGDAADGDAAQQCHVEAVAAEAADSDAAHGTAEVVAADGTAEAVAADGNAADGTADQNMPVDAVDGSAGDDVVAAPIPPVDVAQPLGSAVDTMETLPCECADVGARPVARPWPPRPEVPKTDLTRWTTTRIIPLPSSIRKDCFSFGCVLFGGLVNLFFFELALLCRMLHKMQDLTRRLC